MSEVFLRTCTAKLSEAAPPVVKLQADKVDEPAKSSEAAALVVKLQTNLGDIFKTSADLVSAVFV